MVDELPGKLAPLEHLACRDTGGLQLQVRFVHLLQQQEAELAAQSVSCLKLCYLTLPLSIFISSIFYQTDNCNICSRYFTYFAKILENSEQCNAFILVSIKLTELKMILALTRYKSLVRLELMLCLMFIYIVPQCFVSITTLKLFLIFRAQATAIMAFIELFEHSGK